MFKRYIELCGNDLINIISGLICGSIASIYGVFVSEHTSRIMQGDFSNDRLKLLFSSSLITIITTSLRGSLFLYSQKTMNNRLKCIIYDKIFNQKTIYYQITPVSLLLENITNDVRIVSEVISLNINVISRSIINIFITLWLLLNISYKLTLIALILVPINFLISYMYNNLYKKIMEGYDNKNTELNNFIHESISYISIVKTYAMENKSYKKFNNLSSDISTYYYNESLLYALNLFIINNIPIIMTIIVILCAKFINHTDGLIIFILHNQNIYNTVKTILDLQRDFIKCKEPYERIMNLLDTKIENKGYYIPQQNINGDIIFKNIDFKYEKSDENIITNFNFTINSGDKIAIIGPSGCGKSTIAKLLIGLLTPNNGSIYIDGIDINNYDNEWLKNKIGYVSQDSILFSDTIANNISYGLDGCSEEDIIQASKKANAHEFISKLPNKYQTKLEGTELSSLSGGQKQRISIARALIKNPKIIIFDEATSALDPYCEEIVQNTIKEYFQIQNTTIIIIAHRRSALDIADNIYKLEDSKLIKIEKNKI